MFKKKTFSSVPTECTPNQLETLAKLRLRIRQAGYPEATFDDEYLLRFLCARKFDLEKALQMWKNFIDWRNGHNIDQVMSMEFPDMKAAKPYYPHTWFRTDKQGRPIFIECMGKLKLDEMLRVIPLERVELYFIRDFERLLKEKLPACSAAAGHPVHNTCYIMDLKGASASFMSPKVWEMLKIASKIGQDYYPETLGDMFVVNAPMFVYGAWNIVKHLMDEKTRSKIHILGSNYKNELLKYIDEENLPDFLGGKVPEAEYGPNLINEQGPWVKPVVKQCPVEEKKQLNIISITVETKSIMVAKVEEKVNKTPAKSPMSKFEVEDFEEREIPQECVFKSLKMRPSLMFTGIEAIRCGK